MDSAHGRAGRQPNSSAQNRRNPDLDHSSAKDGKSKTGAPIGGSSTPTKSPTAQLSLFPSDAGPGLGDVVSKLKQQQQKTGSTTHLKQPQQRAGSASPKPQRSNDTADKSKGDVAKRTKHSQSKETANTSKSSKTTKEAVTAKSKNDKKSSSSSKDKLAPDKLPKDTLTVESARVHTPKHKRRAKSATRSKAADANDLLVPLVDNEQPGQENRGPVPVIRLSREDSHKQSQALAQAKESSPKFKRRLSAISQAKIAFEKIAMAVTEAEAVTITEKSSSSEVKGGKDRKARSKSAPREIQTERAKKKTESEQNKQKKIDNDKDIQYSKEEKISSTSMHQQKQSHTKSEDRDSSGRLQGELSIEGISSSPTRMSVTVEHKPSTNPLKLLQSITRPSSLNTSLVQHSSTPSRPRKKFSRGHIDQDPLDVDYEVLDDRVASIEPRSSLAGLDSRKSVPYLDSNRSAEEPLLPKNHKDSLPKHNRSARESDYIHMDSKTQSTPYTQTFPRTKQQETSSMFPISNMYGPVTADHGRPKKFSSSVSTDRLRNYSSNQLSTPDSAYSPLFKVPSSSSFTSSDARSEVCLDLPDIADPHVSDLHLREVERDLKIKLGFPNAPYRRIVHNTDWSIFWAVSSAIVFVLLSFLLIWPLIVVILVVLPCVVLCKRMCSMLCCCGQRIWGRCCVCVCHTHLTSSELMWLGRGTGAGHSVAQSLLVLQKGLDTDRIRNLIDSRLLSVENRHGHKLYPRFTQKVVSFCCGQAWVTDKQFMVAKHIYNMPGYIETLEDLQQFVSKMATQPLTLEQPLWEIQVLHNFREPRDTVLLFRMHLCLTDGVSIIQVLENALADTQKMSSRKSTFSTEAANTSPFKVLFSGPVTFLSRYLFGGNDLNLLHGQHVHPSGEMVVAWSEPFSLSAAMRVKQVARCSLTELLLSITAGNIRSYLQVSGITHPFDVKCAVPVDFQSMDGGAVDMENKYSMVIIQLPTNTEGTIPRLWETKYKMSKFKSSAEAAIVNGARWLTYCLLPVSIFQELWRKIYSKCTLLIANLAGPTSVLKLDSREVKCMMYWVPPLDKVPLTVSFITYADQMRMAVIADRSVIPNPDLLTRDFNFKLETLSKLLAHRRIPGENSAANRHENIHLLSSFTLDDLTAEQIQLEMSLVQQELHEMKLQLEAGSSHHISRNDTELMTRIEALKERSRELMMHLRKKKSEEPDGGLCLTTEEDDLESETGGPDKHQKPFRRRTQSMSSKMSTTSVSSTHRPLSTASTSNLPSPVHSTLPSWPEGDLMDDIEVGLRSKHMYVQAQRAAGKIGKDLSSPVYNYSDIKGRYHSVMS